LRGCGGRNQLKTYKMKTYQILVSGYQDGYLKTQLITVSAPSHEEAIIEAEAKSYLDGATAII